MPTPENASVDERWEAIPDYTLGTTPDNLEEQLYRCTIMKRALIAGYEECLLTEKIEGLDTDVIVDLLVDVRHLCDRLGLDFANHDERAQLQHREEATAMAAWKHLHPDP